MGEAAEAARDLVDAVRDGDVPLFDHRRDRLGRALARYWAARERGPTVSPEGAPCHASRERG